MLKAESHSCTWLYRHLPRISPALFLAAVHPRERGEHLEAPGQAMWYAFQTGLEPGIVLIVGEGEETYLQRLYSLIRAYDLPIRVWVVER